MTNTVHSYVCDMAVLITIFVFCTVMYAISIYKIYDSIKKPIKCFNRPFGRFTRAAGWVTVSVIVLCLLIIDILLIVDTI